MNKWIKNISSEERKDVYAKIGEYKGLFDFAVEKDWWVTRTLELIFKSSISNHVIFKGGTSLSKSWGIIERFSEDIDLAISREFLNFDGILSKSQLTKLRQKSNEFITNNFFFELQNKFKKMGLNDVEFKIENYEPSDRDPQSIIINYPNITETGYIRPEIKIEIGCRSLIEPYSFCSITSYLDEFFVDEEFSRSPFEVPSVNPEKTFLEKIFLLHEEFHKPLEKIRVNRLSRHLYDVYQLSKTDFSRKALENKELYKTILEHRIKFTRISNIDYNTFNPKTLDFIPIDKVFIAWKYDYESMKKRMIYQLEPPEFDEIIKELKILRENINNLDWDINIAELLDNRHIEQGKRKIDKNIKHK